MARDTFTLPEQEEMLRRLVEAEGDQYLQEKFYPLLLVHAGTEKHPVGIVMLLQLAIADFADQLGPSMRIRMWDILVPRWIKALCPTKELATQTLEVWARVNQTS